MAQNYETAWAREFSKFERSLKKLEKITMDDSGKTLRKYSSVFAANLVRQTQPRGAAKKAQAKGEAAIAQDIRRVYVSPSTVYLDIKKQSEDLANAMWQKYKDNDIAGFIQIMEQVSGKFKGLQLVDWDSGQAHKSARGPRGRVKGGSKNYRLVRESQSKMVLKHIKETVKRVGYTKAGWISNFNPEGGLKGIPKWVIANKGSQGKVLDKTRNGTLRAIEFYNNVEWVKDKFMQKSAQYALNATARIMARDLEKLAVEAAKKV